jgi:hypothetical protein
VSDLKREKNKHGSQRRASFRCAQGPWAEVQTRDPVSYGNFFFWIGLERMIVVVSQKEETARMRSDKQIKPNIACIIIVPQAMGVMSSNAQHNNFTRTDTNTPGACGASCLVTWRHNNTPAPPAAASKFLQQQQVHAALFPGAGGHGPQAYVAQRTGGGTRATASLECGRRHARRLGLACALAGRVGARREGTRGWI